MKKNSHGVVHPLLNHNPTTKLWGCLTSNVILATQLPKYLKFVELAIIMVLGSVEDERTFSIMNFMKSKLHNHLTTHLHLVVRMFM
jgi:hypothetical protein